jgi:hypothetical protein
LAFAAALALYGIDVVRGIWDHDAGFFLQQAALVAAGHRPYLDFAPFYPPLMAVVNAVPIWLGLDRYALVVGLPVAWTAAVGLVTVACARRLAPGAPPLLAWLLGAGYALFAVEFGGNHVTLEHAVVLWGLVAVACFGPPERARAGNFAAAGLACGLALLSKQVALVLLLPFLLQVRRPVQGLAFAAGVLAPLAALVAGLGFDLRPLLGSATQLAGYAAHDASGGWWSFLRHLKAHVLALPVSVPAEFRRATLGVVAGVASGLAGTWVLERLREDRARRQALWVATWLVVGGILLATRLVKDFPHYTLNCWVPLVVAWLAFVDRYGPQRTLRAWGVTLVTGVAVVALHAPWNPGYTTRFGHVGTLDRFLVPIAADLGRLLPAEVPVVDVSEEQVLLFLARRLPANTDRTVGPYTAADVDRWVPDRRRCFYLTTPIGPADGYASMDTAVHQDPNVRLVREWREWGRHLRLHERR